MQTPGELSCKRTTISDRLLKWTDIKRCAKPSRPITLPQPTRQEKHLTGTVVDILPKKDYNLHMEKRYNINTAKNSGVDARTEPPNQTAYLWMGWLTTLTSTGCD